MSTELPISEEYRLCSKSVMDSSDPGIVFDADGVSNYWKENLLKIDREVVGGSAGLSKAEHVVRKIQKESVGAEYNCLIGVSGGIDSSMIAYWVKKLGLNPLAVHMDNGWNSEIAVSNIETVMKKLDIDLHTEVLDWPEFRDLQRSFFLASVPNCEIPTDHAIVSTLFRIANKFKIRYIISGSNVATEGVIQRNAGHDNKDWTHIADVHRKFGKVRLKNYPRLSMMNFAKAILVDRVEFIPLLNYLDYNWLDSIALLENELGWKRYPRKHGESLFTRIFQEYYLPQKFGIDKRRMHYSSLICVGQMTRDEALKLLEEPLYSAQELDTEIEFLCDKLQFTKDEFAGIMSATPKRHFEYRTSPLFRNQSSKIYRWARRLATGRDV